MTIFKFTANYLQLFFCSCFLQCVRYIYKFHHFLLLWCQFQSARTVRSISPGVLILHNNSWELWNSSATLDQIWNFDILLLLLLCMSGTLPPPPTHRVSEAILDDVLEELSEVVMAAGDKMAEELFSKEFARPDTPNDACSSTQSLL